MRRAKIELRFAGVSGCFEMVVYYAEYIGDVAIAWELEQAADEWLDGVAGPGCTIPCGAD